MDSNNLGNSNLDNNMGGMPSGTPVSTQEPYIGASKYNSPLGVNGQPVFDQPEFDQPVFGQPTPPPFEPDYNVSGQPTPPPFESDYNVSGQPTPPPFAGSNGEQYYGEQQNYPVEYDNRPPMILAFGILSLVCCAPLGIAAIVLYCLGKDSFPEDKKSMATAGFVCSIVALAIRVVFYLLVIIIG